MYLPTDFGKDIKEGAESIAAETDGMTFASETTHKPDDADFVGALQKLNADGCEIVALALGVRQAITVSGTAKKLGLTRHVFPQLLRGLPHGHGQSARRRDRRHVCRIRLG